MSAAHTPGAWPCSPQEAKYGAYDERTIAHAQSALGRHGPAPLMKDLNRIHQILSGIGAVLRIVNGNAVVKDQYDPEDPNSMPPLSEATEGILTAMAAAVCEQLVDGIERQACAYNKEASE